MSVDPRLDEQIGYYRAIAEEYETHTIDAPGQQDLLDAFDQFNIGGDLLELACGPGQWTERLLESSDSITAVDTSPEMIARASRRVGNRGVRFIEADLFSWRPDRKYDSVFFGFWLSHVPEERFDGFWTLVADSLKPTGRVFFVDDNYRTEAELIEGPDSPIVERRLNDGTAFRAIKVPYKAGELGDRLTALGWEIEVSASGPFYWGTGNRRAE